jgi:long-chain acyl-CoA synthetase
MALQLNIARYRGRTLPAILAEAMRRRGRQVFIEYIEPSAPDRPPRQLTFEAFGRGVARAACALRNAGVGPGRRILLFAENSPEWQMMALAAQLLRAESAAVFASLSSEPVQAIARRVAPRLVFASDASQWAKLAQIAPELAGLGLARVICADPIEVLPDGVRASPLAEVVGEGAPELSFPEVERLAAEVGPEDPFLLLFTSGTTGRSKGVCLPQRAIVHAIDGGRRAVGIDPSDRGLHFLPFGHVAGHDQFALALAEGHTLLMVGRREDVERGLALQPTYLFSVPLLYDRIRQSVLEKIAGLPRPIRALARGSLEAAERVRVDGSHRLRDRILARVADRLIGRTLHARLGGRIRGIFSGGAAASQATFRFFEALRIPFVELYGMTETAGLISSNLVSGVRRPGSAGLCTPDHQVRFAPDGELLLRGPLLFTGYLDAEDTEAAFSADGFFRTGDVGRLDAEGLLRVEGRKKHLMVLSTGKKLSPEPIEQAIASAAPFEGAVLVGEGRPFVSAAVFVAREELARLAAAGKDAAEELLPRVRAALSAFSEYEKPKRLVVIPGAPQDHPALVTPTLKVKRDALLERFGSSLAALYGAS